MQGYKSSIPHFLANRGPQDAGLENTTSTCFPLENSDVSTVQTSYATGSRNERSRQTVSSEFQDVGSVVSLNPSTLATSLNCLSQNASLITTEKAGRFALKFYRCLCEAAYLSNEVDKNL